MNDNRHKSAVHFFCITQPPLCVGDLKVARRRARLPIRTLRGVCYFLDDLNAESLRYAFVKPIRENCDTESSKNSVLHPNRTFIFFYHFQNYTFLIF